MISDLPDAIEMQGVVRAQKKNLIYVKIKLFSIPSFLTFIAKSVSEKWLPALPEQAVHHM